MVQLAFGSERCNDLSDRSHQHQQPCYSGDLFPIPVFVPNDVEDFTPITKIQCGSAVNRVNSTKATEGSSSTATTKTPPVEPSISPEIQSGFPDSMLVSGATPSPCYGVGHMIVGVTDKRKCRPKGILSAGRSNSFESNNTKDTILCLGNNKDGQVFRRPSFSMIPLPMEASISWRLSPSNVDDNDDIIRKDDYSNELNQSWKSVSSTTVHSSPSPNNPKFQEFVEASLDNLVTNSFSSSPSGIPGCKAVLSNEARTSTYDFTEECSPFSVNSLSSENVMQTPNSDSSPERRGTLSWLNEGLQLKHQFESVLDQVTNVLKDETLSPKSHVSPWEPPGLSFQSSDIHAFGICNTALDNEPRSQMQISWSDGLRTSSFDIDGLDCCRLLSDEENDADEQNLNNNQSQVIPNGKWVLGNGLKFPELVEHEARDGNKLETSSPTRLNSCAESISTDGGGLTASGDSDWTLYYKNQSF